MSIAYSFAVPKDTSPAEARELARVCIEVINFSTYNFLDGEQVILRREAKCNGSTWTIGLFTIRKHENFKAVAKEFFVYASRVQSEWEDKGTLLQDFHIHFDAEGRLMPNQSYSASYSYKDKKQIIKSGAVHLDDFTLAINFIKSAPKESVRQFRSMKLG